MAAGRRAPRRPGRRAPAQESAVSPARSWRSEFARHAARDQSPRPVEAIRRAAASIHEDFVGEIAGVHRDTPVLAYRNAGSRRTWSRSRSRTGWRRRRTFRRDGGARGRSRTRQAGPPGTCSRRAPKTACPAPRRVHCRGRRRWYSVISVSMLVNARLKVRRSRMRAATSSSTPFTSTSPSWTLKNRFTGSGVSTFSCTIS